MHKLHLIALIFLGTHFVGAYMPEDEPIPEELRDVLREEDFHESPETLNEAQREHWDYAQQTGSQNLSHQQQRVEDDLAHLNQIQENLHLIGAADNFDEVAKGHQVTGRFAVTTGGTYLAICGVSLGFAAWQCALGWGLIAYSGKAFYDARDARGKAARFRGRGQGGGGSLHIDPHARSNLNPDSDSTANNPCDIFNTPNCGDNGGDSGGNDGGDDDDGNKEEDDNNRVNTPGRTARLQGGSGDDDGDTTTTATTTPPRIPTPQEHRQQVQGACDQASMTCTFDGKGNLESVTDSEGNTIQAPFGEAEYQAAGLGAEYAANKPKIEEAMREFGEELKKELEKEGLSGHPSVSRGVINVSSSAKGNAKGLSTPSANRRRNRRNVRVVKRNVATQTVGLKYQPIQHGADKIGSSGENIFSQVSKSYESR